MMDCCQTVSHLKGSCFCFIDSINLLRIQQEDKEKKKKEGGGKNISLKMICFWSYN